MADDVKTELRHEIQKVRNRIRKYKEDGLGEETTKAALLEMHRQVGVAKPAEDGLMYRGLMIRHLVMPNRIAGTKDFVRWVARELPRSTYVNIMAQYRVEYRAYEYPPLARGITREEFLEAMGWAECDKIYGEVESFEIFRFACLRFIP